jgi:4-alpha-glucanotransferase
MGIGEFEDLKKFGDWADAAGLRMVQILPFNDTTVYHSFLDSYPYRSVSVFALNPAYMRLRSMAFGVPGLGEGPLLSEKLLRNIDETTRELNAASPDRIDYPAVAKAKHRLMLRAHKEQGDMMRETPEYRAWLEANAEWAEPYAAFCALRDRTGTADPGQWGKELRHVAPSRARELARSPDYEAEANFWLFVQYHLHLQLSAASAHLRRARVVLKGDLPIGVSPMGVDAWIRPELFHLDTQTGAPPDAFSANGQNWGFPTYNWDAMAKDGYAWWAARLRHMAQYVDAFRIDHILGFFRIWQIPAGEVGGMLGRFYPSIPLSRDELERVGLWDIERMVNPLVRDEELGVAFPDASERQKVIQIFLEPSSATPGGYTFLPQFAGDEELLQRHTFKLFGEEGVRDDCRAKDAFAKLAALRANVCLLRDRRNPDGAFHPRASMPETSSFQALPPHARGALYSLYENYFYRRQDANWFEGALCKLPALQSATEMLVCGEDLGMVPGCVPPAMRDLGILSLRIQRMPADSSIEFDRPETYPYLSVCSPSTHDMTPLRAFWEEDIGKSERLWHDVMGVRRDWRVGDTLTGAAAEEMVRRHFASPSMWAVVPIQDLLAIDEQIRQADPHAERINEPSNPHHYWRFRLHLSNEQLMQQKGWTERLRGMLEDTGRL